MKNRNQRCFGEYDGHHPEPEDYTGEDGLLYGKCRKRKTILRRIRLLSLAVTATRQSATVRAAAREEQEAAEKQRRHLDTVGN